jgi:ketosteroid isomerase-like protein
MKTALALAVVAAISLPLALSLAGPKMTIAAVPSLQSPNSIAKDGSIEQQIVSKEREGLEALKTGDLERFASLTADEAVFVDTQGPAGKAQVLKNVIGFTLTEYSMEDVKFVPISANSGLISYKITETGVSHGKNFTAQVYVSSIWTERGGKWVCLFSQETAARRPVATG